MRLLGSAMLVLTSARFMVAQPGPVNVSGPPICPSCRITLTPVVTLGARDSGLAEWPQAFAMDAGGRFYLTFPNRGEPPMVYSPDGRFLQRVGSAGDGPGEFRAAAHLAVDRHDTLFVVDWTGRTSVFSLPDMRLVRAFPTPPGTRAVVVLQSGVLVLNSSAGDAQSVGRAFHLLDRKGSRVGTGGRQDIPYLPGTDIYFAHRMAPANPAGFWALPLMGQYRIDLWDSDGLLRRSLRRSPSWFVPLPERLRGIDPSRLDPPPSQGVGVWEAGDRRLWTVWLVADPERRNARRHIVRTPEGEVSMPEDPDRVWDTVVEVLDPQRGRLIVSQRFDELFDLTASGHVAHISERQDGLFQARISRMVLTGAIPH